MASSFASAIYSGKLRHRRFFPKSHEFAYDVFMMYLDTSEIETIFSLSPWWSLSRFAPVQYRRSDFHVDAQHYSANHLPGVDESVRNTVEAATGCRPTGPIRMLVNLRYWGFNMNPLSTYYCFDSNDKKVTAILAEVNNTPWNERHAYVLTGDDFSRRQQIRFTKKFHVSPFNPIDMDYQWISTTPDETLSLHLENWKHNEKVMDATLTLRRESINQRSLNKILIRFPWMTVKVISAIYWQALRLWWKGVPVYDHVDSTPTTTSYTYKNTCKDSSGKDSRGNMA